MKVVTANEMQGIDGKTISKYGIPGHVLMDRAGAAVASKIKEILGKKKIIVIAGGGNNGGDGLVCARDLAGSGWNVKVLMLDKQNKLSPDCMLQMRVAKKKGVPVEYRAGVTKRDLHGAVVVDAMLGTGLNKNIEGSMSEVIAVLNRSDSPVMSIDIPSGISSDTGRIMGAAVKADYTVTFGLPKRGHFLYPGAEHTGRLFIEDIGFPEDLLTSDELCVELIEKGYVSALIPDRPRYSHKGDYGHVLIVAGSRGKTGAALMAAKACMRAGAGLVTLGVPESLIGVFQSRVTEEMTLPLPDRGDGSLSSKAVDAILRFLSDSADILCIGPGIGVSDDTRTLLSEIIQSSRSPVIIDADGINSLSQAIGNRQGAIGVLKKARTPIILTPHTGEMARLLQGARGKRQGVRGETLRTLYEPLDPSHRPNSELMTEIEHDRINAAISFSRYAGTYLVLKGAPTIVAEPGGKAFINPTGNPGMATAGTGDVLTGIIGSFLGQGLNPLNASIAGVYIHGLAGDIASQKKGEHSLIASDIIESLPAAFRAMNDKQD